MKRLLLLLLLVPVVNAYYISDWPFMFVTDGKFNAKYVVGDEASALDVVSATVISTSLAKYENVTTEVGTSKIDSEISDISIFNAVVIGSPCELKSAYQLMGSPEPCYKDLAGGLGYIKVFEKNGRTQILITGIDDNDRNAAAKFLAEKNLEHLDLTEYIVQSGSGSVPPYFSVNASKNESNVADEEPEQIVEEVVKVSEPVVNVSSLKNDTKPKAGKYDALDEVPVKKKKGFWATFWSWISSWFS